MLMASSLRGDAIDLKPRLEVFAPDAKTRAQLVGGQLSSLDCSADNRDVEMCGRRNLAGRQEVAGRSRLRLTRLMRFGLVVFEKLHDRYIGAGRGQFEMTFRRSALDSTCLSKAAEGFGPAWVPSWINAVARQVDQYRRANLD